MAIKTTTPAPWRSAFLSHVNGMESPTFTLSTLHPVESESASASGPGFAPRSRTVVFRGMWAGLPVNPKNDADQNPDVFETDLPTITSDTRMEKISELLDSGSGAKTQSGVGGPVEAMFWVVEDKNQWRLRGQAYVIGPDIETAAGAPVREALEKHMRSTGGSESWSWSREVTAHFGNLSPFMRGTFKNPPPGTPLSEKPGEGLGTGQKVEDLQDKIARRNFCVVVIVPDEVDRVDLSDPKMAQRWNYKLAKGGLWDTTELWP
ncbi:hypothetical protein G7046_g9688 [Stylonectria norvegica]|nr:hypothetical protein G7046_g9688 [Stylonectria norvegica]